MPTERRGSSGGLAVAVAAAGLLGAGALAALLLARAPAQLPDPTAGSASPATTTAPLSDREQQLDDERAHYTQLRAEPDPARSLAMADEGQERFVQGSLYPDREVIAIRALLRLDRRNEADRRAQRFLRRYGSTPQAELVRRMMTPSSR